MTDQEIWIKSEIERISQEFSIHSTSISKSTTNGISFYILYRGHKVRFSDHMTSAFSGRHIDEIHVSLSATKSEVDSKIEKINPDNYKEEIEIKEVLNTEFGIKKLFPNAIKINAIESKGLSKKGQKLFLFEVTVSKQVFVK